MLVGTYQPLLVCLSLLVAVLSAYTALDLAARIAQAHGTARRLWLCSGACAMGVGIWSMHFVGMLAFSLGAPLGYDPVITALSLVIAIGASACALWIVAQPVLPRARALVGAVVMGLGIAAMHYIGMAAMRMQPAIQWNGWLVAASIALAIIASALALFFGFKIRSNTQARASVKLAAASVMGLAICGMHYLGMAAASFPVGSVCGAAHGALNADWLALLVVLVTAAVLSSTLIVSLLDMRMESKTGMLASSLAIANRELTHLASHDALTNLPNRRLLQVKLEQAIVRARDEGERLAVLFIDLDGFKLVNDAYGHHVGDLLLQEIATRIGGALRTQDTISRVGGDEFIVLAAISEHPDAGAVASKLLDAICVPAECAGYTLTPLASIGIAIFPDHGAVSSDLLAFADSAMYDAKHHGAGGFRFFEPVKTVNVHRHARMLHDLAHGLASGEFSLRYRPIAGDAGAERIVALEAMPFWRHPELGDLGPEGLSSLTERHQSGLSLAKWMLQQSCRQLSQWRAESFPPLAICVKLSVAQLVDAGLLAALREALTAEQIAADRLVVAVAEFGLIRRAQESLEAFGQLRRLGVGTAIVEFGTVISQLQLLRSLGANDIVIDEQWTRHAPRSASDAAIVRDIVDWARSADMRVHAEESHGTAPGTAIASVGNGGLSLSHREVMLTADEVNTLLQRPNAA